MAVEPPDEKPKKYNRKKYVHLLAHSYAPTFFDKTPTELFQGDENDLYAKSVKSILNSAIAELELDKNRKFTFSNAYFFKQWWE